MLRMVRNTIVELDKSISQGFQDVFLYYGASCRPIVPDYTNDAA